jgi:hypothetical protein
MQPIVAAHKETRDHFTAPYFLQDLMICAAQHKTSSRRIIIMHRSKAVIAALTLFLSFGSAAFAGDKLGPVQLKRLVPGRYLVTLSNAVNLTVVMRANGTVSGSTKSDADTGKWMLDGSRLCIGFTKWLGGNTRCSALVAEAGYYQGSGFTFRRI